MPSERPHSAPTAHRGTQRVQSPSPLPKHAQSQWLETALNRAALNRAEQRRIANLRHSLTLHTYQAPMQSLDATPCCTLAGNMRVQPPPAAGVPGGGEGGGEGEGRGVTPHAPSLWVLRDPPSKRRLSAEDGGRGGHCAHGKAMHAGQWSRRPTSMVKTTNIHEQQGSGTAFSAQPCIGLWAAARLDAAPCRRHRGSGQRPSLVQQSVPACINAVACRQCLCFRFGASPIWALLR